MVEDGERRIGLQYVLVQSYPPEEKHLAEDAVAALRDHGVPSTVEMGLPWAPRWYSVVGMKGFDRTKDSPEYRAYVSKIEQVSDKFAGTSKFKQFEPKPLRWQQARGQ